ncbi:hypothetical protein D3C72_1621180 [compost metagenome]
MGCRHIGQLCVAIGLLHRLPSVQAFIDLHHGVDDFAPQSFIAHGAVKAPFSLDLFQVKIRKPAVIGNRQGFWCYWRVDFGLLGEHDGLLGL